MLGRLLAGTTGKRKSPKKAAAVETVPDDSSDVEASEEYIQFALAERQNLEASGITSDEDIEEEIARRWKVVLHNLKPVPEEEEKSPSADVKILPILLDDKQLTALDYIYIGPTKTGEHMYGVKKGALAPGSLPIPPTTACTEPLESSSMTHRRKFSWKTFFAKDAKTGKSSAFTARTFAAAVEELRKPAKKSAPKAVSGSKRKVDQVIKPEPVAPEPVAPESKNDDEPDMKWACKISNMRLLKKVTPENMVSLCKDFGVPSEGTSEQIAKSLSVQLHYETDED